MSGIDTSLDQKPIKQNSAKLNSSRCACCTKITWIALVALTGAAIFGSIQTKGLCIATISLSVADLAFNALSRDHAKFDNKLKTLLDLLFTITCVTLSIFGLLSYLSAQQIGWGIFGSFVALSVLKLPIKGRELDGLINSTSESVQRELQKAGFNLHITGGIHASPRN